MCGHEQSPEVKRVSNNRGLTETDYDDGETFAKAIISSTP
jgi:hypothetical protein